MSGSTPHLAPPRPGRWAPLVFVPAMVFAVFLALGGLWIAAFNTQSEAEWWVQHTLEVRTETEELLRILVDAETGQRGYLLTGAEEFLEPYHQSLALLPERMERLRVLTADNPRQQARFDALEPIVKDRLEILAETVALQAAGRSEEAVVRVRTKQGKALMDRIRQQVREIRNEEDTLLEARRQELAAHRDRLYMRVAGGLVALGLLVPSLGGFVLWSNRETAAREAHFRQIFEAASEGIWILDAEGRVTAANPAMTNLLGYAPAEVLGRPFWEHLVFPEDVPLARRLFQRRREGVSEEVDFRFRHRSGRPVWALLAARSIQGPSGELQGSVEFFVDITERRRAEQRSHFVASLGARLLECRTPEAVVDHATHALTEFLDVDRCAFGRLDVEGERLLVEHEVVRELPPSPAERPLTELRGVLPLLRAGERASVEDTCADPRVTRDQPTDGTRAFVVVPRRGAEASRPVLLVASHTPRAWSPGELEMLAVVADRVWVAVDNVTLARDLAHRFTELDALYLQAPVGLAHLDREERFVRVNQALADLDGVEVEAHVGHPLAEVLPAAAERLRPAIARVLAGGESLRALEVPGTDDTAASHWSVACYPLRDPAGDVRGVGLVIQDLTARRRAEDDLRESAALLDTLVNAVPDCVFAKDRAHRVTLANPALLKVLGRTPEQVIGHTATDWVEDARQGRAIVANDERVMASGRPERVDEEFGGPGDVRVFQSVKVPLRDAAGAVVGLVGVSRDITTERHYARMLERTVNERTASLTRSFASLEQLLYSIAHDLRAPNRATHSFAELVELEYGERLDERGRLYLGRIKAAARRNDELIRDLLRYGRLTHEEVPLEPLDLEALVHEIVAELDVQANARGATVRVVGPFGFANVNRTLTKQVLYNLVENALKYVPSDRAPIVEVSGHVDDGTVTVEVADNGIGIPPEHLDQVFEPFARLPQSLGVAGTGMGLAIVRKAAERMHGEVGVRSEPQVGSRFWVRLPVAHEPSG